MSYKEGGYTQIKAHTKQLRKRREAEARQAKYDTLTHAEKIALVTNRGGSKRELARLTNPKTKSPVAVPVIVTPSTPPVIVEVKRRHTPKSKVVAEAKTKRPAKS
jgi:hypothetical protein